MPLTNEEIRERLRSFAAKQQTPRAERNRIMTKMRDRVHRRMKRKFGPDYKDKCVRKHGNNIIPITKRRYMAEERERIQPELDAL